MRYDENADTLEFDWFQNEPSNRNLEDSSQWHSVNEARRVFGRKPVDKFLTRYLSCGIDTVKVQVPNFLNRLNFSQIKEIILRQYCGNQRSCFQRWAPFLPIG